MTGNWLRRGLALAAAAAIGVLAGCGSSSIESQFTPARVVAFGDALADLGQTGKRYTVNDSSINIWTQEMATSYGYNIGNVGVAGGTSYATAHARVALTPDATGNASTPTVTQQVSTFLASSTPSANDLYVLSAGTSDVIYQGSRAIAGTQTTDAAIANVRAAGTALGEQVRRLVNAGAKHVAVVGPYNLGKTPWAAQTSQGALLETLSSRFNDALLLAIVDLGESVLYIDAALEYNLFAGFPTSYGMTNATTAECTSVDAGVGIGIGTGQVNSGLCTTSTIQADAAAGTATYLWADPVYPTPIAARTFGDYAYQRLRQRW